MPTKTIRETALVAYDFATANIKTPLISIAPYAFICELLRTFGMPDHQVFALIGFVASGYVYSVFAAQMHRAFINGTPAAPVNPLQPTKDDLRFIGMFILLTGISLGVTFGVIFVFVAALHNTGVVIGIIALLFLCPFMVRLMILLPDRAVGGNLTLKEALRISDGLFWKIFLTPLLAGWRLLLAGFIYVLVTALAAEMIIKTLYPAIADKDNMIHKLILFVIQAPVTIGLVYWVAAIGIAGLSNYYLLAKEKQNAV